MTGEATARDAVEPREVAVHAIDPLRLQPVIGAPRMTQFEAVAAAARELLGSRPVINLNSTAAGGGVAEMLQTSLAYARGVGIDARWHVIEGDAEFFAITKRIHNNLYGGPGDGGPLASAERAHYEKILRTNGDRLRSIVRAGDVVILHDPQTAGLGSAVRDCGASVVWRCHVGRDDRNEHTDRGWNFLRPYVEDADALVFSRQAFAPPWADPARLYVIPPSIDPFSTKNVALGEGDIRSLLGFMGFRGLTGAQPVRFTRRDGSPGRIEHPVDVFVTDPPPADAPLVVQVSRWDALKDMRGVMLAFAGHMGGDAHLLLVGPDVGGVADDSEAATIFDDCMATWTMLAPRTRARVHLACLPMHDTDVNSLMTNAIQRSAAVVTQKSIAEGFGLTVAEAMWKQRPVVASRVGGISDQIVHGVHGLLVDDPRDLATFAAEVTRLLEDRHLSERLGRQAHRRASEELLGDRHLERWGALFAAILR
jgi:trehalose synthase